MYALHCIGIIIQQLRVLFMWQDSDGDTALHEAIYRGNNDVLELLLTCSRLNFTIVNLKTFTAVHQAAFKGNV